MSDVMETILNVVFRHITVTITRIMLPNVNKKRNYTSKIMHSCPFLFLTTKQHQSPDLLECRALCI